MSIKPSDKKYIEQLIRVNHAGEYGAKRIYEGQLAFIKDPKLRNLIYKMYEQELTHLEFFQKELTTRKIRPTALLPFWHISGYMLGALTALMGPNTARACTEAVEEIIEEHYDTQINNLGDREATLSAKLEKIKQEEIHHRELTYTESASPTLKMLIGGACKLAISIAKKI